MLVKTSTNAVVNTLVWPMQSVSIHICLIVVFAAQAIEKLVQARVFGNSFFVKIFPLSF